MLWQWKKKLHLRVYLKPRDIVKVKEVLAMFVFWSTEYKIGSLCESTIRYPWVKYAKYCKNIETIPVDNVPTSNKISIQSYCSKFHLNWSLISELISHIILHNSKFI